MATVKSPAAAAKSKIPGSSKAPAAANPAPAAHAPASNASKHAAVAPNKQAAPAVPAQASPVPARAPSVAPAAPQSSADVFAARIARPLKAAECRAEDVANVRRILMSRDCLLLYPCVKSQLSEDNIRSLLVAGGHDSACGALHLQYLSCYRSPCVSLAHLTSTLTTLRAEAHTYLMDLFAHFNNSSSSAGARPIIPQASSFSPEAIEALFKAGGGLLTFSCLHALTLGGAQFASFPHLVESLSAMVPSMLHRMERMKDNMWRMLQCSSIQEFVLDGGGDAGDGSTAASAGAAAGAHTQAGVSTPAHAAVPSSSSQIVGFPLTIDTVRHILYLGLSDVQLLYLLTRHYVSSPSAKARRFLSEKKMLLALTRGWAEYLSHVQGLIAWVKTDPRAIGMFRDEETGEMLIPAESLDGPALERLYRRGDLGPLTMEVMQFMSSSDPPLVFSSLGELLAALQNQGEVLNSVARLHAYLNGKDAFCALWPHAHVPRAEITERMITDFLSQCPRGTSITLVLKECKRFERLGLMAANAKLGGAGGVVSPTAGNGHASGTVSRVTTARGGGGGGGALNSIASITANATEEYIDPTIPPQFHDWAQLSQALLKSLPTALAQMQLDRENLQLTLQSVSLFLASGGTTDKVTNTKAHTTHDLDSLLAIAYEHEHSGNDSSAATSPSSAAAHKSAASAAPFTVTALLTLLRKWHTAKRKFADMKALRTAIEIELEPTRVAANASAQAKGVEGGGTIAEEPAQQASVAKRSSISSSSEPVQLDVWAPLSPSQEKQLLREFFSHPARRLLTPPGATPSLVVRAAEDGTAGLALPVHVPSESELDALIAEKNAQALGTVVAGMSAAAAATAKSQASPFFTIHIVLASLAYMERTFSTPFLSFPEFLQAVRAHFALIQSQMTGTLKYLKSAKRLFADASLTNEWTRSGRELAAVYLEGQADLDTLAIIRRMERERYQQPPFINLRELLAAVRAVTREWEEKGNIAVASFTAHVTQSDRARILAALINASQVSGPKPVGSSVTADVFTPPAHQPLLPLALLEDSAAAEQILILLKDMKLHTVLQQVAALTHTLTQRATDEAAAAAAAQTVPPPIPLKPLYSTWIAFSLALHDSVLESNRVRTEVFTLLSSPKCVLLSAASSERVPITFESVDRLVRACGLLHKDMLLVLHQLTERGIRHRSLASLAARIKSFHQERLRAEQLATRYALVKSELLAYIQHDSCQLFITPEARAQVCEEIKDDATHALVQIMQTASGIEATPAAPVAPVVTGAAVVAAPELPPLKTVLQLLHALENDSQAFDSLGSLLRGMRSWREREKLKKRFLPWLNSAACRLLVAKPSAAAKSPTSSGVKEIKADDPALHQLLSINVSEEAMADLRDRRMPPLPMLPGSGSHSSSSSSGTAAPSAAPEPDPAVVHFEAVFELLQRWNADTSLEAPRFTSFTQLVKRVQHELEQSSKVPAREDVLGALPISAVEFPPLDSESVVIVGASPSLGPAQMTPVVQPVEPDAAPEQQQQGYESDEEVDVRGIQRAATVLPAKAGAAVTPAVAAASPVPSSTVGPAGLTRTGTVVPIAKPAPAKRATDGNESEGGDDIDESPEERQREAARREARRIERARVEEAELRKLGWVLSEDAEWLPLESMSFPDPELTEALLNERRLLIFSALSFPACLLFSDRVEPLSLSAADLDAIATAAGPGERGVKIAQKIIRSLDKSGRKFTWFDEVTLEIARRWQRRRVLEWLQNDAQGKSMCQQSGSLPVFVLRLMSTINRSNGVDPALHALDVLKHIRDQRGEGDDAPFHTQAELLVAVKEFVVHERRAILRDALVQQFSSLFPRLSRLPPLQAFPTASLDLVLAGVDNSLHHALKYLEQLASEGAGGGGEAAPQFDDVLEVVASLTSMHAQEKNEARNFDPDQANPIGGGGDEEEDDDLATEEEDLSSGAGSALIDTALMIRRQKIFLALSFPRCTLFSGIANQESFTLSSQDLDDVVKACSGRVDRALRLIAGMEKEEPKLRFQSFFAFVTEVTRRSQAAQVAQFILSADNKLLAKNMLPRSSGSELDSLVTRILDEGMGGADCYLNALSCLRALNQVPRVLAQAPPPGGYRSIDSFLANLQSLAAEQRSWMVRSYFVESKNLRILTGVPPNDLEIASMLHACAHSVYFLLRHFTTLEQSFPRIYNESAGGGAEDTRPTLPSYAEVISAVAKFHAITLHADPSLAARFMPSDEPVALISKPNDAKQKLMHRERVQAKQAGVALDMATRKRIMAGPHPGLAQIQLAAAAVAQQGAKVAPAAPVSPRHRALSAARLSLLQALSFPASQLFSKCLRPVAISPADLDAVFRATPPGDDEPVALERTDEEEEEEAAAAEEAAQGDKRVPAELWVPHESRVAAALKLVRALDGLHVHCRSFAHFLTEFRALGAQQRRDELLSALFFPRCTLFTQSAGEVSIDDDSLDVLLCGGVSGAAPLPLPRVLAAIARLDASGCKVQSFHELLSKVQQELERAR